MKKTILNIILLCIVFYVTQYCQRPIKSNEIVPPPLDIKSHSKVLSVNTSQCQMAAMEPLSPIAVYYMTKMPIYSCFMIQLMVPESVGQRNYLYLTATTKQLWQKLGVRRLSEIYCAYNRFERIDDFRNKYFGYKYFRFSRWNNITEVQPGNITIRVVCWLDFGHIIYHDVLIFLPNSNKRIQKFPTLEPVKRLSVIILGIDSISHMHYRRYFSQFMDYIDRLPHVEMWGYNRVGRNSYPNLMPLLSGQSVDEVESERGCFGANKNISFDRCKLLWNDFKAAGYTTILGEDSRVGGTFTYLRPGFERKPTDYYLRSVMNEIHLKTQYSAKGPKHITCSANRVYHHVLHNFFYQLLPQMQASCYDRGFFAFFWQTMGVHDYFQYGEKTDLQYYLILKALQNKNILNRTLVVILSDHGLRFGPFVKTFQGMREVSLPMMVAIYPNWLSQQYPLAVENLQANSHRLMTTYDIHETLKDVLDLENLSDERIRNRTMQLKNEHKISLFLPIPEERSCFSARIPLHYCQCEGFIKIPWNVRFIQRIATFAVDRLNSLLLPYKQCHKLKLLKVEDAYLHNVNESFTVRLVTEPGNGHFDATVAKDQKSLLGPITRTDQYRHQAYCAQDEPIAIYCYCS
ncbi:uncharacterized protein LOC108116250 [Drosophila eugracilis]|uniref:uncharacterized protein LOC108116250 n=1 Tax=Drosophila eugracilis TaxID=29029 RepID=UPI001BDA6026|nr:uncharacterized protein LOC108116250 [Drosophila eugracilis]